MTDTHLVGLAGPRIRIVWLAVLAWMLVVGANSAGSAQDQARPTFRTRATVVSVTAVVTGRDGAPVTGLRAEDFELFDEGRRQRVVAFDAVSPRPAQPRAVPRAGEMPVRDVASNVPLSSSGRAFVFVVDPNLLQIVLYQRVLIKLFSLLTADDLAAVVFPRRSDLSVDFTGDPVRLAGTLDQLGAAAGGNDFRVTGMALDNAMNLLETIPLARKVIVWVSGGFRINLNAGVRSVRERSIASDALDLFAKGKQAGIPIYTIDPWGLYREATTKTEFLKTAALASGGASYVNRSSIVDAAQKLMVDSGHYYVLGFAPEPLKTDGKFRRIEVRIAGRLDLHVQAREGYVAAAAPSAPASAAEALKADIAAGRSLSRLGLRAFAVPVGPAPGGRTRVVLTMLVRYPDAATLPAVRDRDALSIFVLALDPDARVLASRERRLDVPSAVLRGTERAVTFNETVDLPRGPAVLRMGAASEATGGAGAVSLTLDVPRYSTTRPALSPLVLALAASTPVRIGPVAGSLPFQPSTLRRFPTGSAVRVFSRAFGVDPATLPDAPKFSIASADGALKTIVATLTSAPKGVDGVDISGLIPLNGLSTGTYVITLALAAPNGESLTQAVQIEVE